MLGMPAAVGQLETRTQSSPARKHSNSLPCPAGWRAAGELRRAGPAVSAGPAAVPSPRPSLAQSVGGAVGGGSPRLPLEQPGKKKTNGENRRGHIKFLFHALTPMLSEPDTLGHALFKSSIWKFYVGDGCLGRAEAPRCSPTFPHFLSSGEARAGGGLEGGAGRGERRGCAGLRVSMSMCLSFTPPLSAAAAAAAATSAAGIAAAPSLARRRYLLGQVRSNAGGERGGGRAAGTAAVAPPGASNGPELAGRKHVPAKAASCLSVGKPPLDPRNLTCTTYQCLQVNSCHSPHLAAPGEPGTASGRGPTTRWEVAGAHGLVRGTARRGSQGGPG